MCISTAFVDLATLDEVIKVQFWAHTLQHTAGDWRTHGLYIALDSARAGLYATGLRASELAGLKS